MIFMFVSDKFFAAKVQGSNHTKTKTWQLRSKCGEKWGLGTKYPHFRDEFLSLCEKARQNGDGKQRSISRDLLLLRLKSIK